MDLSFSGTDMFW